MAQAQAQEQAQEQEEDDAAPEPTAEDLAFEKELTARNPDRKYITRYDFPEEVEEARAVYVFKMKARDELLAAETAELTMSAAERKSSKLALEAERREAIKLSIVALITVDPDTGAITRRHVDQSVPLIELDEWSSQAWGALRIFHGDLNGIPWEELGKAVRRARRVGATSARSTPLAVQPKASPAT